MQATISPQGSFNEHERTASAASSSDRGSEKNTVIKEIIIRTLDKNGSRSMNKDGEEKQLLKMTHLHLDKHSLKTISGLNCVPNLEVLYLYDNRIEIIEGLDSLKNLTHLYLQNNLIAQIAGLQNLRNLQKLYLQGNCIHHISGLERCIYLQELHISNQRLLHGHQLTFDNDTLAALSRSLSVLTANQCNIADASFLCELVNLRQLQLSSNLIKSLDELEASLPQLARLQVLDLRHNPVCKLPKYRDNIILLSDSLISLDDERISPQQREFLLRFHLSKLKAQVQSENLSIPQDETEAKGGLELPVEKKRPTVHPRAPPRAAGFCVTSKAYPGQGR